MNLPNKKVYLMISPNFPPNYYKFALELRKRDFIVLGIGDAYINELSENVRNNLDEYVQCYDMKNISSMINIVQYFINKYGKIDFLESNNEYWLEEDSTLREWFNISSGLFHKDIMKYKKKSLMKQYFINAGAKIARWHLSDNFESTLTWANEVGFPIFVKPNIGVGASNTHRIKDSVELSDFYKKYDGFEYIFEQFIDGNVVSFDGITDSNGNIIFKNSEFFLVENDILVNCNMDDAYYTYDKIPEDLDELGTNVVKAFDIKKRCFHIEFFRLNENSKFGKKDELYALEVNLRPAGGFTPDIISLSQNVNFYAIYADMIAYDKNLQDLSKDKCIAITASRRNALHYVRSVEEILEKYKENISQYGVYPEAIRDDMGDSYFIAKFNNVNDALKFQNYVREKQE